MAVRDRIFKFQTVFILYGMAVRDRILKQPFYCMGWQGDRIFKKPLFFMGWQLETVFSNNLSSVPVWDGNERLYFQTAFLLYGMAVGDRILKQPLFFMGWQLETVF